MDKKAKLTLLPGERLILPAWLRKDLSRNYGKVVNENELMELAKRKQIISIGDEVTSALLRNRIIPKLAIFDFKTKRRRRRSQLLERTYPERIKVRNRPGVITYELWKAVEQCMPLRHCSIQVIGEEDLAALVCIHFAPAGSLVVYGLPGKGIEMIKITNRTRKIAEILLARMKKLVRK